MRPKRKDIEEIRRLALYLNGLSCLKGPSALKAGKASKNYHKLKELIARYEHLLQERGEWFTRDLEFGVEVLQDKKVQKLCLRSDKPGSPSIRAISVPFESNRRRH